MAHRIFGYIRERVKCKAMDEAMAFLKGADPEKFERVADEIVLRCHDSVEVDAICAALTLMRERVRLKAGLAASFDVV